MQNVGHSLHASSIDWYNSISNRTKQHHISNMHTKFPHFLQIPDHRSSVRQYYGRCIRD